MSGNGRPRPEHGTYSRYTSNPACRCDLCRDAARKYKRKLKERGPVGWQPSLRLSDMIGGGWMEHAGCLGEPTVMFFPEIPGRSTDYTAAKSLCVECPVRDECLGYALNNQILYGVWGGKTPDERWEMQGHRRRNQRVHDSRETA